MSDFAGGSGTAEEPYLVETAEHLDNVRDHLDAHFEQIADIDLDGWDWQPISIFKGSYNGADKKIYNLTVNTGDRAGLFGQCDDGIKITNVHVDTGSITSTGSHAGGLIGAILDTDNEEYTEVSGCSAENVTVSADFNAGGLMGAIRQDYYSEVLVDNCSSSGSAAAGGFYYAGGLIGLIHQRDERHLCTVKNSYSSATAQTRGGGFIGYARDTSDALAETRLYIEDCHATGDAPMGGFIGSILYASGGSYGRIEIDRCSATGDVIGSGESNAGGFVGAWDVQGAIINNCYARGDVEGEGEWRYIGGFFTACYDEGTSITNCYATGEVRYREDIYAEGGFGGECEDATVTGCYFDQETTGQEDGIGSGDEYEEVYGRTTEEMTYPHNEETTYIDWAFEDIWWISPDVNDGYPVLEEVEVPDPPSVVEPIPDEYDLQFVSEPRVDIQQPSANTVTVVSPEASYTAQTDNLSEDEVVHRRVEIDEGEEDVCQQVAERLLERWSREQISVTGDILLNMGLEFRETVRIVIEEALIDEHMVLQKLEHNVEEYTTTVTAGDIIVPDNELLARIIDEVVG